MIDIKVGKIGQDDSFMNTTYNFTNHINFIGFTHEMWDKENPENNKKDRGPRGGMFLILNKAYGIYLIEPYLKNLTETLEYKANLPLIQNWYSDNRGNGWPKYETRFLPNENYLEGRGRKMLKFE